MAMKAAAAATVPPKVNSSVRAFSKGASRMFGSITTNTTMITAISAAIAISRRVIRLISVRTSEPGSPPLLLGPVAEGVIVSVIPTHPTSSASNGHVQPQLS